jgi:hypothetical protein
MTAISSSRRRRRNARPRRFASLAVDAMETRLALSPALPAPPLAASVVWNGGVSPSYPNGPCIGQGVGGYPAGPALRRQ